MTSINTNISENSGRSCQSAAIADQSHRAEHYLAEDGPRCPSNTTPYAVHVLGGLLVH